MKSIRTITSIILMISTFIFAENSKREQFPKEVQKEIDNVKKAIEAPYKNKGHDWDKLDQQSLLQK